MTKRGKKIRRSKMKHCNPLATIERGFVDLHNRKSYISVGHAATGCVRYCGTYYNMVNQKAELPIYMNHIYNKKDY